MILWKGNVPLSLLGKLEIICLPLMNSDYFAIDKLHQINHLLLEIRHAKLKILARNIQMFLDAQI